MQAGKLAIHHDKKTFPLEIQPSLPPIKSISIDKTSAQEGSNAKTNETALAHRGDIDQESEEPDIICLLELGLIYKVIEHIETIIPCQFWFFDMYV